MNFTVFIAIFLSILLAFIIATITVANYEYDKVLKKDKKIPQERILNKIYYFEKNGERYVINDVIPYFTSLEDASEYCPDGCVIKTDFLQTEFTSGEVYEKK